MHTSSKGKKRSWRRRTSNSSASSSGNHPNEKTGHRQYQPQTPFITIEGVKYFSDRFYLNAPTALPYFDGCMSSLKTESKHTPTQCQCQHKQAPPHFDRIKLINSLDLVAVIVGTYTLDPKWLQSELPMCFPQRGNKTIDSHIPILVLHGTKGIDRVMKGESPIMSQREKAQANESDEMKELYMNHSEENEVCLDDSEDEIEVVHVQPPPKQCQDIGTNFNKRRKSVAKKSKKLQKSISQMARRTNKKLFRLPCTDGERNDGGGDSVQQRTQTSFTKVENIEGKNENEPRTEHPFGKSVYFTEILPCYLPAGKVNPSMTENGGFKILKSSESEGNHRDIILIDDSDDEECSRISSDKFGVHPEVVSQRKRVQGVYHPKFMLLFEKSGSVIVVISSSNMTPQRAVDASWVQRFEPAPACVHGEYRADAPLREIREKCDGSDFGYVLSDFLQKQSEAAQESEMLPIQFLRKYVGHYENLDDFRRSFCFHHSQVHLVSTVPGYYPGRFSSQHLNRIPHQGTRIFYGPQRVADILNNLTEKMEASPTQYNKAWLPQSVLSEDDRLVVQTTSFGGKWTSRDVDEMARQYMGQDDHNDRRDSEANLIENIDIVWPTMKTLTDMSLHHRKMSKDSSKTLDHFVFLASEGFNDSSLSVLSQMKIYEFNTHSLPVALTPHIKTYSRLLKNKSLGAGNEKIAWTMLSSACFSRGAQGFTTKRSNDFEYEDERAYSNFELGVLFVSRLQGDLTTDRLYTSYQSSCDYCNSSKKFANVRTIPLPFPYKLQSRPYQSNPDDAEFYDTPFFHLMTKKSIASGKCLLTPFGKCVLKKLSR